MKPSWKFSELDESHAHLKEEISHYFVTNGLTCSESVCALLFIRNTI